MSVDGRLLLLLTQVPGIGSHRLRALMARFGSPEAILRAPPRELRAVEGIDERAALHIARFLQGPGADEAHRFAERQVSALGRAHARMLTLWDDEYPAPLRKIYDPPPLLFLRGRLDPLDASSIAVVGTRSPSPYGIQVAGIFSEGLARLGITIVSGLARGIDTIAHHASLRAEGRTVAVIGSGVDIIYPSENADLAARIMEHGAVVSECPMGAKPDACNFPRRNRIISGMTLGTLVIETTPEGGAVITATAALDQNREVFAVPSPIRENAPLGTNRLIKEGKAQLVDSVDDILRELAPRLQHLAAPHHEQLSPPVNLSLFEQQVADAFTDNAPVHLDVLAERTAMAVADLLVHLLSLEFNGVVRQLPGKYFARTGRT